MKKDGAKFFTYIIGAVSIISLAGVVTLSARSTQPAKVVMEQKEYDLLPDQKISAAGLAWVERCIDFPSSCVGDEVIFDSSFPWNTTESIPVILEDLKREGNLHVIQRVIIAEQNTPK